MVSCCPTILVNQDVHWPTIGNLNGLYDVIFLIDTIKIFYIKNLILRINTNKQCDIL